MPVLRTGRVHPLMRRAILVGLLFAAPLYAIYLFFLLFAALHG